MEVWETDMVAALKRERDEAERQAEVWHSAHDGLRQDRDEWRSASQMHEAEVERLTAKLDDWASQRDYVERAEQAEGQCEAVSKECIRLQETLAAEREAHAAHLAKHKTADSHDCAEMEEEYQRERAENARLREALEVHSAEMLRVEREWADHMSGIGNGLKLLLRPIREVRADEPHERMIPTQHRVSDIRQARAALVPVQPKEHHKHPTGDYCIFCRAQWPCEESEGE